MAAGEPQATAFVGMASKPVFVMYADARCWCVCTTSTSHPYPWVIIQITIILRTVFSNYGGVVDAPRVVIQMHHLVITNRISKSVQISKNAIYES